MADQGNELFGILAKVFTQAAAGFTPLKWDSTNKRLYIYQRPGVRNSTAKARHEKQRTIIHVGIHRMSLIILIGQVILFSDPRETSASVVLNLMGAIFLFIYHSYLTVCRIKSSQFSAYVNALLDFGERMQTHGTNRQRSFNEKVCIWFAQATIPAAFIIPIGYVFGLHWLNPYGKVSLIGYFLLGKNEKSHRLLLKVAVFLFNYWVWTVGVLAGIFCMIGMQCLLTISFRECIRTFWNMEANPGEISFDQRSQIYRQIQLIGSLQTEAQAGSIMTIFFVCIASAFPLCAVPVIRLPWTRDNAVVIVLCGYLAVICIIGVLFLVSLFALAWSDSKIMFQKLDWLYVTRRNFMSRKGRKLHEAFWGSCRNLIKVKFGVNNFVEKDTPLNCLHCNISLTVHILLLVL